MRMVFAAMGVAAVLAQTAAAAPRPQTLYTSPGGTIDAFAQDGTLLAWFAPSVHGCNKVWVLDLSDAEQVQLPEQSATAVNVTCNWTVMPPVRLALDAKTTTALWTLREQSPLRFDYLLGASLKNRLERRFQEIAHAARGAGLWLGGIAADGGSMLYSVTSVDFVDEVKCLSTPKAPGACALMVSGNGGVWRIVGRSKLVKLPGTSDGAIELAVSGADVAYVPAGSVAADGRPLEAMQVDVRDVNSGKVVTQVATHGTPLAIALSSTVIAAIEQASDGLHLTWYDVTSGRPLNSAALPANTSLELAANAKVIAYHVGRAIHTVDIATGKDTNVARAEATPIGLSIQGMRLAWAENLKGVGRIRALTVPG